MKEAYGRAIQSFERFPTMYGHLDALRSTPDTEARALYAEFTTRQHDAFGVSLRRLRPERRGRIVDVMDAVLDSSLREWSQGRRSIRDVVDAVESAAELLLTRKG